MQDIQHIVPLGKKMQDTLLSIFVHFNRFSRTHSYCEIQHLVLSLPPRIQHLVKKIFSLCSVPDFTKRLREVQDADFGGVQWGSAPLPPHPLPPIYYIYIYYYILLGGV